jgi:hypothetical protein
MCNQRNALAIVLLIVSLFGGCARGPHGSVWNITRQEHPALISGEMDWGSEVGFDVKNEGERGMVHISVTLSCSEGQWARSQDLLLEAGQPRHLTYFFPEPTIAATNFQALVHVNP